MKTKRMYLKAVLNFLRLFMDKIYLIGHRGVGKTQMVKSMGAIQDRFACVDLDEEIVSRTGKKTFDIIMSEGLEFFRQLEFEVLQNVESTFEKHKKKKYIIALGAGFNIETYFQKRGFPENSFLLWLRKTTDPMGRIFFDRPSLILGSQKPIGLSNDSSLVSTASSFIASSSRALLQEKDIRVTAFGEEKVPGPSYSIFDAALDPPDPIEEWNQIYLQREKSYGRWSQGQLFGPEFFDPKSPPLYQILFKKNQL